MNSIIARIGEFVKHHREHIWRAFVLLLIGWSAFNIGLLRARQGSQPAQMAPLLQVRDSAVSRTPETQGQGTQSTAPTPDHSDLRVVVSKGSSSKKYHHSWCSSGTRIKEANRLWFPTAQDAQAAGYTLAGNCTE